MSTGFGAPPSTAPSPTAKKLKQSLMKQFEPLDDPRVKRRPEHLLLDIVAIANKSGAVWSQRYGCG